MLRALHYPSAARANVSALLSGSTQLSRVIRAVHVRQVDRAVDISVFIQRLLIYSPAEANVRDDVAKNNIKII